MARSTRDPPIPRSRDAAIPTMTPRRAREPWPGVSDAELTVLKSLWELGPSTVRDLQARLESEGQGWAYTTVQTLLTRLVEKGYVAVARHGLAHTFRAAVTRDDLAGKRVEELASNLLDGALAPLVLRLVERGKFSKDEILRFRAMLDDAERRGRKGGGS